MNGLANSIQKSGATLEQRGLPHNSFFEAEFGDGSQISEKDANWSAMSEELRVGYFGGTKVVYVCTLPITRISAHHADLVATMEVPEGCLAYQAARSETAIMNGKRQYRVLGRCIGIVRDGEVIEEQFINGIERAIMGTRK